jgi:hypothetical protein
MYKVLIDGKSIYTNYYLTYYPQNDAQQPTQEKHENPRLYQGCPVDVPEA